jgi:hypothetical protein
MAATTLIIWIDPLVLKHLLKELAIEALGVVLQMSSGVLCDSGGTTTLMGIGTIRRL